MDPKPRSRSRQFDCDHPARLVRLDALPSYDALLRMPTVDRAGLRQAMERIFTAYAPLRHDPAALIAADVFVVEDLLTNCALARLCRIGQPTNDAAEFDQLANRVEQAIGNKCYNKRRGIFSDLLGNAEKPSGVVTVAPLLPLMLESLDSAICKRVVEERLRNPNEFWLSHPMPSIAANEPSFDPEAKTGLLWRGSTWVNMNWFLVGRLRQHSYAELAKELTGRTCAMVARGGFQEYYSPYAGTGYGAPNFAWTTLILDFLSPHSFEYTAIIRGWILTNPINGAL